MPAMLYRPNQSGLAPGILVLMEAYGLNDQILSTSERLADAGYAVLAPDLYYRQADRVIPFEARDRAVDMLMRTIALGSAPEERTKDERVVGAKCNI